MTVAIPGRAELRLDHLLLDVNGTLTNRGTVLDGVAERIGELSELLEIHLVSADTFGTLDAIAGRLGVHAVRAASGDAKLVQLDQLGRAGCAVIGNGANDVLVLEAAALGIAVIGAEGASSAAIRSADVVCASVHDALDLLLDDRTLVATLRS
jgi:P-type E1-E2 ATPase